MRSIQVFGKKVTGWQVLPTDAKDFEEAALLACELLLAGDPRIGKVPGARRASRSGANQAARSPKRAKPPKTAGNSHAEEVPIALWDLLWVERTSIGKHRAKNPKKASS
jgi:hypothetical protein